MYDRVMVEKSSVPVTPVLSDVPPKASIPLWVIFLVVFLASLVVGMGMYIGIQRGLFQGSGLAAMSVITPSLSPTVPAAMTPGADWNTYRDEKAGFVLRYPTTVLANVDGKGVTQPILSISVEALADIPESLPLGMGREDALLDKARLEKGNAQTVGDFVASDALVNIGNTYNGRMTSVLSRFEICSVIFSRSLIFYPNGYRVIITLNGNEDQIIASMPEFFTVDAKNCGEQKMWNRDVMGTFMPTLAGGKGNGAGQEWYDTFTAIIKTIELIPVVSPADVSDMFISPTPTGMCDVADNGLCNIISDIKTGMAAKNYNTVIAYQTPTLVTCDPDGMYVAVCDGVAKGVVKEGYVIGYNESEGSVQTRDQHLAALASYVNTNGPFVYKGSLQSGDKGVIVYLNTDASKLFVLYLKRAGSTWRFSSILVGGTFGDTAFATLSPSLLDRVQ